MSGIRKQLFSSFFAEGIRFLSALVFGVIAARVLEPSGRGIVAAAWAAVTIGSMVANLGISKSLVSRLNDKTSVFRYDEYFGALLFAIPVMTGIGLLVLWIVLPSFPVTERTAMYCIVMLAIPVILSTQLAHGILRAERKIILLNRVSIIVSVIRVAVLIILWLIERVTVQTVLAIELGFWSVTGGLLFIKLFQDHSWRPSFVRWHQAILDLLRYGLLFQIYSLLFNLQLKVTIPILNNLAGDESTGQYVVGARLAEYIWMVANQVNFVMVPYLAQQKEGHLTMDYACTMTRLGILFLVPSALILIVISPWFVGVLYGASYYPAVTPFRLLMPGMVAACLFQLSSSQGVAQGRLWAVTIISGIGLVVNIFLNYTLIPLWKESGAALALTCSYTLILVLLTAYLAYREDLLIRDFFLPMRKDIIKVWRSRGR